MGTYVVSGSASGIGAATLALLRGQGHRVIGVDRSPAEGSPAEGSPAAGWTADGSAAHVTADLGTRSGRDLAADAVRALAPDGVNGLAPCAGIGGFTGSDSALLVSVNYFGAVGLAQRLRSSLTLAAGRGEPAAVVLVSSNSVTCQPGWASEVVAPCLDGDEQRAREVAAERQAVRVYPATKAALAYWARRAGTGADWAGAGIRVNAVAPGLVATAMTEQLRRDPELGVFADAYPSALARPGRPEEVAATIGFLLSPQASLVVGSTLFADGGTDALMHPFRAQAGPGVS